MFEHEKKEPVETVNSAIPANGEQHNHWSLEKPPLERFTALDICKFTAEWPGNFRLFRLKSVQFGKYPILQLEDCMRQVIRINWLGASNRGPGLALNSSYYHPECIANIYPNAVVRALMMGELVDMSHRGSELQNLEALPAVPVVLAEIDCDQCHEPVRQAPSYNAHPDAGWRRR